MGPLKIHLQEEEKKKKQTGQDGGKVGMKYYVHSDI